MKKHVASALLAGSLLAPVLATPASAQEGSTLCNGLEPTIIGTEGNDVIQGTWKDDVILALGGNDKIYGYSGADVICGGDGNDKIYGYSQDDVIFGGNGNDEIYGGSDADFIDGGEGNDKLFGDSQDDVINGGPGNDMINGGPDADTLDGGEGNDVVDGSWQDDSCANAETAKNCEIETTTDTEPGATPPVLLSDAEINWSQGSSEWVNFMWTANDELANIEVTVTDLSDGLVVEYPSGTSSSRLGVDPNLSKSEIDFTAVKLTTNSSGKKSAVLNIAWDDADGERQSSSFDITLTNKQYEGEDFAILTDEVEVGTDTDAPQANWIDLDYKGLAPTNTSMAMVVSSELPVYHPQNSVEKAFTSLHHDEVLHAGETDVARVWFDPELIEAGEYTLVVNIDYVDTYGTAKTVSHEVKLTVG